MKLKLAKKVRHKFTKSADLFVAGIVILEVITLKRQRICARTFSLRSSTLNFDAIRSCLSQMLDADPAKRSYFTVNRGLMQEGKENFYKALGP
jgi:hypothetical protein